jgi:fibronectin-binding autotransporter adhesin
VNRNGSHIVLEEMHMRHVRSLLIAVASVGLSASLASAQSTWIGTGSGNQSWLVGTNWDTVVPNAVGATANVHFNATASLTTQLNSAVTLGTLNIAATPGGFLGITVANGTGGSLILNNGGLGASINQTAINQGTSNPTATVSASMTLADNLTVTNQSSSPATMTLSGTINASATGFDITANANAGRQINLSGAISGGDVANPVNLLANGPGRVDVTVANSFTGAVGVSNGVLRLTNVTAASGNTITASGGILVNGAGTIGNALTLSGGTLAVEGANRTYSGAINVTAASTLSGVDGLVATTGRAMTLSGKLSGSAGLSATGAGAISGANTVTLSNNTNDYSGAISVTSGSASAFELIAQSSTSIGSTLGTSSITLNGTGAGSTLRIRDNGTGTGLILPYNNNITIGTGFTGTATLNVARASGSNLNTFQMGSLTVNGNITYNVNLNSNTALLTFSSLILNSNATLGASNSSDIWSVGAMNDGGLARTITKTNTGGTIAITAAPSVATAGTTYAVNGGNLQVRAANALKTTDATPVDLAVNLTGTSTLQLRNDLATNFGGAVATTGAGQTVNVDVNRLGTTATAIQLTAGSLTTTATNTLRVQGGNFYSLAVGNVSNNGTLQSEGGTTDATRTNGLYITGAYTGSGALIASSENDVALTGLLVNGEAGLHFANGLDTTIAGAISTGGRTRGSLFAEGANTIVRYGGAFTSTSANGRYFITARNGGKFVVQSTATEAITANANRPFNLLGDGNANSTIEFEADPVSVLARGNSFTRIGDVNFVTNSATVTSTATGYQITGTGLARWRFLTTPATVQFAGAASLWLDRNLTVDAVQNVVFNSPVSVSNNAALTLTKTSAGSLDINNSVQLGFGTLAASGTASLNLLATAGTTTVNGPIIANNVTGFALAATADFQAGSVFNGSVDTGAVAVNSLQVNIGGSPATLTIGSGKYAAGRGTLLNAVIVNNGGQLRPGSSPGILTVDGNVSLDDAGVYVWELSDASGAAGVGFDQLAVTAASTLSIDSTSSTPFVIRPTASAGVTNWAPVAGQAWTIATSSNLSGYAANLFSIDLSSFNQGLNPLGLLQFETRLDPGNPNNLQLVLTVVPEPTSIVALGAASLLTLRRRR